MFTLRTVVVCLTFAASAAAGNISGTVYDPSGAVVPGATVKLRSAESAVSQETSTDPKGDYFFTGLPAGRYRLEVARPGFVVTSQAGAMPNAGASLQLDVVLRLGIIQESITVERAGGPPAQPESPRRVRVGGNVQPSRVLVSARPAFPKTSQSAGRVLVKAVVLTDGSVGQVQVIASPDTELAEAAVKAVREMRYQPTLLNGQPVETELQMAIDYKMK